MNRKYVIFVIGGAALLAACPPRAKGSSEAPAPDPNARTLASAVQPTSPLPAGPQPEIFFAEPEFDAGIVKQGDVIEHTFVVMNRGLGALNIEKVKGS